jgi:hypothetical protein
MSKYIHKFSTLQNRNAYITSTAFTEPFVSTHGEGVVSYNKDADDILHPKHNGHEYVEIGGLK